MLLFLAAQIVLTILVLIASALKAFVGHGGASVDIAPGTSLVSPMSFVVTSVSFAYIGGHITLADPVYRPLVGVVFIYVAYRLVVLSTRKGQPEASRGAPLLPAMLWGAVNPAALRRLSAMALVIAAVKMILPHR